MRAPALACGAHKDLMKTGFENLVRNTLHGEASVHIALAQDELHQLQSDMSTVRASMETELAAKMDYWLRLPWVLCGCSHPNESLARQAAMSALEQFDADSREVVHDAKTVALMQPGSSFRLGLEQFAGGASRWDRNQTFVLQIAAMRFSPLRRRASKRSMLGSAWKANDITLVRAGYPCPIVCCC